jgi:hypothetical protein
VKNPVVAKRIVELNVTLDDFVSMFSDQRDVAIHAEMLEGMLQTIVSWEHDDFDWPKHLDNVVAALSGEKFDIFMTLLTCLQETVCHYRQFNSDEHETSQRKIKLLKTALADAVRRPMGVVPDSAHGLIDCDELVAAEERRPKVS